MKDSATRKGSSVWLKLGQLAAAATAENSRSTSRTGWEAEAARIQELYLEGRRAEAIASVPDGLVDAVALCGPPERIAERVERWRSAPVDTMCIGTGQLEAVRLMAELLL